MCVDRRHATGIRTGHGDRARSGHPSPQARRSGAGRRPAAGVVPALDVAGRGRRGRARARRTDAPAGRPVGHRCRRPGPPPRPRVRLPAARRGPLVGPADVDAGARARPRTERFACRRGSRRSRAGCSTTCSSTSSRTCSWPHHGPAHDELVEPVTRAPSGRVGFLIAKDLDPDDADDARGRRSLRARRPALNRLDAAYDCAPWPYPRRLINEGETVVLDLKPHWWFFAKHIVDRRRPPVRRSSCCSSGSTATVADRHVGTSWGIVALVVGRLARDQVTSTGSSRTSSSPTTASSTGPACSPSAASRSRSSGSTTSTSTRASSTAWSGPGRSRSSRPATTVESRFSHVRHPDGVQQEIYRQMEAHGRKRAGWHHEAAAAAAPVAPAPAPAANIPEQLQPARRAARQGRDQPRPSSRRRRRSCSSACDRAPSSGSSRSCRRRPRRCTRSASRRSAVTRFCDVAGPRRRSAAPRTPIVDAIVALAPDLVVVNDEENRAEDADALAAAGLALHSMSPRSVDDVGPEVRDAGRAGRARRSRRRSAPASGTTGSPRCSRPAGGTRSWRCGAGRGCRSRPTPTARRCSTCSASATCSPTRATGTRR